MSDLTNSEYFAARALDAWNMSRTATDPRAALAHAEMAERYQQLEIEFKARRAPIISADVANISPNEGSLGA